jgi:hypothetical protein
MTKHPVIIPNKKEAVNKNVFSTKKLAKIDTLFNIIFFNPYLFPFGNKGIYGFLDL